MFLGRIMGLSIDRQIVVEKQERRKDSDVSLVKWTGGWSDCRGQRPLHRFLCIFALTVREPRNSTLSPSTVQNVVLHLWERGLSVIKYKSFSQNKKLLSSFLSCVALKTVFCENRRHKKNNESVPCWFAISPLTSRGKCCIKAIFKKREENARVDIWKTHPGAIKTSCPEQTPR